MEGVAKINQKIMKEAIAEANKIVSEANEKAAGIKKEAAAKVNDEKKKVQNEGKKNAAREEQRILSSANLESHNLRLQSMDNLLNKVIAKAESKLKSMSRSGTGRYKDALNLYAKEGISAIGEDSKLCFNEENSDLGKALAKELNAKTGKSLDILGGVVVESSTGELRIDNSIERIMERESEQIRGKIAGILFASKK